MICQQRSIEAGKALEPHSNFLFQPMSTNIVDNTLTGCVLAFRCVCVCVCVYASVCACVYACVHV